MYNLIFKFIIKISDMKKQFLLLVFVAIATLTSCKKKNCTLIDAVGTPVEMITGTWSVGYVIEKDIDATGKVINSKTTQSNNGVTGLRSNGTYFTLTGTGKWELSTDGKKIIYDKGAVDERFYSILKLNYATWIAEGPYKTTDSKPYFSGKLYEYENIK
jgi:hypothetical protein